MNFLLGLIPNSFALIFLDVRVRGAWIETYDTSGRKISAIPSSGKEVKGVGNDFFVVLNGSRIETYNSQCKKIASVSASDKVVVQVSDAGFSIKRGWWVKKYDKKCNKLESRIKIKQ